MRTLLTTLFVAAVLALSQLAVTAASGPYPTPPPDFAHPGSPHNGDPLYSPVGGDDDRRLLLVVTEFTDVTSTRDAAFFANWMFGGFPSLAGYFAASSFGRFVVTAAPESSGTANDGVVFVNHGNTYADYFTLSEADRNRRSVSLADPFVNYAAFDDNTDGRVTDDELIIVVLTASQPGDTCGATRGISPNSLDGKSVEMSIAMGGTLTNLMTDIHEVGHSALHMRDLYGFGVGSFDISGPTCGAPDSLFFSTGAWQKTHWGWITPTVVVQDGYYLVDRADTNPEAFILYDPSRGSNDYFIVETRVRTAGTYEQSASDSGLVIWRVDDAQYNSGDDTIRPIEIMRPDGTTTGGCTSSGCYGGSSIDAWDPTDPSTPQRTMNRTWRDGTASNVAVRAIGPRGDTIRAYFDVRGPGILVDAANPNGTIRRIDVTPDEANPVSFTVMNTGEASDAFSFTVEGLPLGWSASTQVQTLGAGAGSTANVAVNVPGDAAEGTYTVRAVGRSNSDSTVVTVSEFQLRVVLHTTSITYTGSTSVPWGEPAGFRAQLTDTTDPSDIVVGAVVTFTLSNGVQTQTATATSDGLGVAAVSPALAVPPGNYTLTIASARSGKHGPATKSVPYVVEKRPTHAVYAGDTTADYSDRATASARLTDLLSGVPLAGKPMAFAIGTQTAGGVTDGLGNASVTIVLTQPSGIVTASAAFVGDALYLPSSASAPFTITKETLTFTYTGDTLVALGSTPQLAALAVEEADGSPGDLSLAGAHFHLVPTLTTIPFDYITGVDAGGLATTAALGLGVDLWSITVEVPGDNAYWQGSSPASAELVLYDPAAAITAGGYGDDASGNRAQVTASGRYAGSAAKGEVEFRSSVGRFKGGQYAWIVAVGHKAIFQMDGELDGTPAVLRLRMDDIAEPGARIDLFHAWLAGPGYTPLYDSGPVVLQGGNLRVEP